MLSDSILYKCNYYHVCKLWKIYLIQVSETFLKLIGIEKVSTFFSDIVIGGFTTKPSNAFPRSGDLIIFNCTTQLKYFPWWTIDFKSSRYMYYEPTVRITNASCQVVTSAPDRSWFMTETLAPGSCNLIVYAPANSFFHLSGVVTCIDSTLSSARAILAPVGKWVIFPTIIRRTYNLRRRFSLYRPMYHCSFPLTINIVCRGKPPFPPRRTAENSLPLRRAAENLPSLRGAPRKPPYPCGAPRKNLPYLRGAPRKTSLTRTARLPPRPHVRLQ